MDKLKDAWTAFDASLPRMWKQWLVTMLIVAAMYLFLTAGKDRALILLAKVPLLTLGGILGYHGDRALFPYARPGDLCAAWKEARNAGFAAHPESEVVSLAHAFNIASIRRAIIVAASIIGASLAA